MVFIFSSYYQQQNTIIQKREIRPFEIMLILFFLLDYRKEIQSGLTSKASINFTIN